MSRATLTIEGYLARDPELAYTRESNDAYLPLSIPHTPRRLNKDTGQWEDAGETLWVGATLWREQATVFAPHLRKGTLVRVEGEPVLRAWESNGKSGVNLEIRFARVWIIPRAPKREPAPEEPWSTPGSSATTDADGWASPSYGDDTPF